MSKDLNLSPEFAYRMTLDLIGSKEDTGAPLLSANRAFHAYGICERQYFPFSPERDTFSDLMAMTITPEMLENAKLYRPFFYDRLYSVQEIKAVLASERLATIGVEIFDQMFTAPNGIIEMPTPGTRSVGGHCIRIVGYNDHNSWFIFANSWGTKWGNDGYGYLPYEYVNKYCADAFTVFVNDRGFVQEPLTLFSSKQKEIEIIPYIGPVQNRARAFLLRARLDDNNIGWLDSIIISTENSEQSVLITELFVMPEFRRNGLGNELMRLTCLRFQDLSSVSCIVPKVDVAVPSERSIVERFLTQNNFHLTRNTPYPWAEYVYSIRNAPKLFVSDLHGGYGRTLALNYSPLGFINFS